MGALVGTGEHDGDGSTVDDDVPTPGMVRREVEASPALNAMRAKVLGALFPESAAPERFGRYVVLDTLGEGGMGTVLRAFEDEMEAVVALAFFIPLLIGTGGNTGTQITTTLVRAMATGQVRLRDVPAVLAKELSTGSMVALTMALAAVVRAWTLGVGPEITLTVALTVAAIVMWSSLISSILPPLLKKIRVDPALVSAPLIATIVDGTGLIIYFMIAHATLSQLQGL